MILTCRLLFLAALTIFAAAVKQVRVRTLGDAHRLVISRFDRSFDIWLEIAVEHTGIKGVTGSWKDDIASIEPRPTVELLEEDADDASSRAVTRAELVAEKCMDGIVVNTRKCKFRMRFDPEQGKGDRRHGLYVLKMHFYNTLKDKEYSSVIEDLYIEFQE